MIPDYPKFKIADLKDREVVDSITNRFPPYCDFNFLTLLSWSSKKFPSMLSLHNGNLVLKIYYYEGDQMEVSFLGNSLPNKTATTLLKDYKRIIMVPEESISQEIKRSHKLLVEEDDNNHDYILSLDRMATLAGHDLKPKRKALSKFLKSCSNPVVTTLDLNSKSAQDSIEDLLKRWANLKKEGEAQTKREFSAIEKWIFYSKNFKTVSVGIYDNDKLIALTLNQIKGVYAMGGFGKADFTYSGIYAYLEHATAKELLKHGCKYLNYEQDLGIESLRKSKKSWRPVAVLKKYAINSLHIIQS